MTKTQNDPTRTPFSGGPKAALLSSGADTFARAWTRLSAATRKAARR
jgi:hypothetical protein